MLHTMWKGSVSFGLVNIPVKLFSATESKDIRLRQLHKECHTPIKYEKICPTCETKLESNDIVKAFEYVKDKYVVLEDQELELLREENEAKSVEIVDFVKLEEIDPIYFDRSYFIGPGDNGKKAYALLREALKESGKIGVAKITIRSKEQLAVIRVYQNNLVMETIHYPDEVRNADEVPGVPETLEVSDKELETAITLIDQLTAEFEPDKYRDEYRIKVQQLIEGKVTNNEGRTTTKDTPKTNVVDLMSALQASLEKTKTEKKPEKDVVKEKKKTAGGKKTSLASKKASS